MSDEIGWSADEGFVGNEPMGRRSEIERMEERNRSYRKIVNRTPASKLEQYEAADPRLDVNREVGTAALRT